MRKIRVRLKERSYDILIGRGLLDDCGAILKRLGIGRDAVCITNSCLFRLYGKPLKRSLEHSGFTVRFEKVPDSEKAKTDRVANSLIRSISLYDKGKKIFIINLGGGVVGDVGGFVASIYRRGVPYVHIPTTLLAQVDSAIGGKVAIDLPVAKNLVGSFYQPKTVIADTNLIKSLGRRQLTSGLAEVIKYGIIKDKRLFTFLEKNREKIMGFDNSALEYIVVSSAKTKAAVVEKDEFDRTGIRAVLNFGHTIGHAIEAASGYSKRYNHGEAIAIGMVSACKISSAIGMIDNADANRIIDLISMYDLPTYATGISIQKVYASHLHDKKFIRGRNRFILPSRIGSVKIVDGVSDAVVKKVLKEVIA
jgi:3-dehydroquinate synthase